MPQISLIPFAAGTAAPQGEQNSKAFLGGKGHSLVMMTALGIPVPPGMIIPTTASVSLADMDEDAAEKLVDGLMAQISERWLALTDPSMPDLLPLMAVRSGAPISMPGMMDTILNVGITSENVEDWAKLIGPKAAWDSYRRLIQMLGATAFEVPAEVFEFQLARTKRDAGVTEDSQLDVDQLKIVVERYLTAFKQSAGWDFPDAEMEQMEASVRAVFRSWYNERAEVYRDMNGIAHDLGTAVVVQQMVFGNTGDTSATGVLFTRNPSTGENKMFGEFLINAQGEDVVAGVRTPQNIDSMLENDDQWPPMWHELSKLCGKLEAAYKDMVDIEFTIDRGKLYCLQSRVGKRSALAAFEIAVAQETEGLITREVALKRLNRKQFVAATRPFVDPAFTGQPDIKGLPASPGVAKGRAAFNDEQVFEAKHPTILIRHETTPDDIKGMAAAKGILTATGGATSHAAVVARAMDKPCVVGCTGLLVNEHHTANYVDGAGGIKVSINQGDMVVIDGSRGLAWINQEVPVIDGSQSPAIQTVIAWCRELNGSVPQVKRPIAGPCQIAVADFDSWEEVDEVFEQMLAMDTQVVLDCRTTATFFDKAADRDADAELLDMVGPNTPENRLRSHVGDLLKKHHKELTNKVTLFGATVGSSTTHILMDLGYKEIKRATCMADLINGTPVVLDQLAMDILFGTKGAYDTVMGALKVQGIEPEVARPAAHDEVVVFATLSA